MKQNYLRCGGAIPGLSRTFSAWDVDKQEEQPMEDALSPPVHFFASKQAFPSGYKPWSIRLILLVAEMFVMLTH